MPALALLLALAASDAETNTKAAIDRVQKIDPQIHAVLALDPTALDQARALDRSRVARGPLFGLPILIKDNIETRGPLPTTAGSLALAANVTGRDAPLVACPRRSSRCSPPSSPTSRAPSPRRARPRRATPP